MSRRRETIQLSLGPTANAVTAHLLNLEGLSVTASASGSSTPVCDPSVTHRVDPKDRVWVPRVMMVDEAHRLQDQQQQQWYNNMNATQTSSDGQSASVAAAAAASSTWGGAVQEFNMNSFSLDQFSSVDAIVSNLSFNSNEDHTTTVKSPQQAAWLSSWQQTSSQLAYAPYSQYRASDTSDSYGTSNQQQQLSSQTSRHVDWDDMGEEPEEDEEERAALQERQQRQQQRQWNGERQQTEDQLSGLWQTQTVPSPPAVATAPQINQTEVNESGNPPSSQGPSESDLNGLSWMDYWMPPRPSPLADCVYGLPSTLAAASLEAPPLHAFNIASNTNVGNSKIILEEFWEKIRVELERTDSCQGFNILTEGCGIYAGMTDWLLQELQQECRAAGRWVFQIADDDDDNNADLQEHDDQDGAVPKHKATELARAQRRVRNRVQCGLAMSGLSDKAHVLVPLKLPSQAKNGSLFRSSAELAMALETVMLPYRCQSSSSSTLVGWNSMSGYEEGASPGGMSLGDYLTTLQPSSRYSLLELDTVTSSESRQRLGQILAAGTSVERDPRTRRAPTSTEYPGAWLQDEQFGASPGILTSLSPGHLPKHDRSLHRHFGLSTCLRRTLVSDSPLLSTNQQYLTSVMEGMGIRHRPETAFGLVTHQSLTQLAASGNRYGAGSYWQYLLGAGVDVPVLSVLGNTTRMYPHLNTVSKDMKDALTSSKSKGFYEREVAAGTLPESDDCAEAMESCWDLRDAYEPPNGSGLVDGDDDPYFDD